MSNGNGPDWSWECDWSFCKQPPKPTPNVAAKDDVSPLDTQIGGDHYKNKGIQPVEYCMANSIGFMEGSVIKYVTRWRDKGGVQDLLKARHFLDMLIDNEWDKE